MHMLYNSDHFAVVQIEVPAAQDSDSTASGEGGRTELLSRGGYEIVDKQARRGVFLDGAMAEYFKAGVEDLIRRSPSSEEIDDYLAGYTELAQQPVVLH